MLREGAGTTLIHNLNPTKAKVNKSLKLGLRPRKKNSKVVGKSFVGKTTVG